MPKGWAKIRCRRAVKRRLETRRISSFNFAGTIQFPESAAKERLDIFLLFSTKQSFFSPYIYIYIYIKLRDCCPQSCSLSGSRQKWPGWPEARRNGLATSNVVRRTRGQWAVLSPTPRGLFFILSSNERYPRSPTIFVSPSVSATPSRGRCSSFSPNLSVFVLKLDYRWGFLFPQFF